MKKTVSIILALIFAAALFSTAASAQTPEVTVYLNGAELKFDTEPTIINGSTMVPLRGIFEALGYTVIWDAAQSLAAAYKKDSGDGSAIVVQVGSNTMYVGTCTELETNVLVNETNAGTLSVAPVIQNSRVLVPLRAISEASGARVVWDGETYSVDIISSIATSFVAQEGNVMMSGSVANVNSIHLKVFNSDELERSSVKTITFFNTLQGMTEDAWDISRDQNGSVMAWFTDGNLYIAAEGRVRAPEDGSYMFAGYTNLTSISFNGCFTTADTTNMRCMFYNCKSLPELDLSGAFDTSSVVDMYEMFYGCTCLSSLNLGDAFNTSSVTNMKWMFAACSALENLSLGALFDTSSVTATDWMFSECKRLCSLDLGDKFDTGGVKNMMRMFSGCASLTELNLGDKFNTASASDMEYMFANCTSLTTISYPDGFTTAQADTSGMFSKCPANRPADFKD